ncbi:hypothetical protein MTP99_004858, partial [Tenebrio molitor]
PEETPEKTPKNNLGQQLPRQIGGDAEETRKGTTRTNCVDFVNIVHKCRSGSHSKGGSVLFSFANLAPITS